MNRLPVLLRNLALIVIPALALAVWARGQVLPTRRAGVALLLGMAAAMIALVAGLLLPGIAREGVGLGRALLRSFVLVAGIEEISRLVVLPVLLRRAAVSPQAAGVPGSTHAGPRQYGLRVGALVGVGFAVLESLTLLDRASGVLALRAVTALPVHVFGGAALGLAFGMANTEDRGGSVAGGSAVLVAFLIATAAHGGYDLLLTLGPPADRWAIGVVAAMITLIAVADVLSRRADQHAQ